MLTKKKREKEKRRIINTGRKEREREGKKNHACGNIVNIRAAREWNDSWPFLFYFTASKTMECVYIHIFFFLFFLEKKEGLPLPLYMERSFFSVVFFSSSSSFSWFLERHQLVPTLENILSSFQCILLIKEEEDEQEKLDGAN